MKNEKLIWVKINNANYYYLLVKLNQIGVTIYDNIRKSNYLLIKTTYKDFERIKKYLVSYKIEIYKVTGILKLKELLKKYIVFTLTTLLGIIILIMTNNLIFKVDIKSPNKNTQLLLKEELKKSGIAPFHLKKSHKKIEKIVKNILDNNKETLEWMEIKYNGLIVIVNITEKTIINNDINYPYCHIVSNSDAKITSVNLYRGVSLKEVNDYVTKGEVIISGDIMFNDEIKNQVCAQGEVYGEVWYKVKVEVPFIETYVKYTGKNRYNIRIDINDNDYTLLKSRIKNKKEELTELYSLNDFKISLVKEKEYTMEKRILTEKEAYDKGVDLAVKKINLKLDKDEKILLKKVLKKEVNDSTIYLEIFIVTKENIGVVNIIEGGDTSGSKLST